MSSLSPMLPLRHRQFDFFIADIFDNVPIKDEMITMEHPFFSLGTRPDLKKLTYEQGDNRVDVIPSSLGMPTIFDKDILLYCGSAVMREIREGRQPSRTLRTSPLDILVVSNREKNGKAYKTLLDGFNRLRGCTINTTFGSEGNTKGFGFIEDFEIIRSQRVKGRITGLNVTLSKWYYESIIAQNVLTIHPEYFQIRKSIDRRFYEIARKHCGRKREWAISLEKLHKKTGSRSALKKTRFNVRELVKSNHLPEYLVSFNAEKDMVRFRYRGKVKASTEEQTDLFGDTPPKIPAQIPPDLLDDVRKVVGVGADYYQLWDEWKNWKGSKNAQDMRGAFIGFCQTKVAKMMRA